MISQIFSEANTLSLSTTFRTPILEFERGPKASVG